MNWFDDKKIAILAIIGFILSTIPFFYLSHYARPSSDDLGYAVLTRAAWLDSGSLWEVHKAALQTVHNFYNGWAGEWLAFYINSLMPEVFMPYAFWVGCYFFILSIIVGTIIFLFYFFRRIFGIGWEYAAILSVIILIFSMQYNPNNYISIYWFTGAVKYILPQPIFLIALVFASKFILTKSKKYIALLSICALIVGGISYSHSLLIFVIFPILLLCIYKKAKHILWLLVPYAICVVAFLFQMIAPGNRVRAGSEFGLSFESVFFTIFRSLKSEVIAPFQYLERVPLLSIALIGIIVFGWLGMVKAVKGSRALISFRYPFLYIVIMFLLNSALNAPYIYAVDFMDVDNSTSGPMVVEYLFFFLTWASAILYLEGWLLKKFFWRDGFSQAGRLSFFTDESKYRRYLLFPSMVLCLLIIIFYKGNLKDSFAYQTYVYVESGAAAEYKWRIAEYMEILLDESIEEVYLKPINDVQGPLLHWTVMEDETNYVNWAYKAFYRKKRVVLREE